MPAAGPPPRLVASEVKPSERPRELRTGSRLSALPARAPLAVAARNVRPRSARPNRLVPPMHRTYTCRVPAGGALVRALFHERRPVAGSARFVALETKATRVQRPSTATCVVG